MNLKTIGILFIVAGVLYGSMAFDAIYSHSLGWLIAHNWVPEDTVKKATKENTLGRKPTILLYSLALIIIGIYLLWKN